MGRELRMVPPGWQHPKDARGHFIPLHEGPFGKAAADWDAEAAAWDRGEVRDYSRYPEMAFKAREPGAVSETYAEYAGDRPRAEDYMPEWTAEQATLFCMYEDTSEGTPISPAFETAEELARWLADTNASAFAGEGATYEQWLATIKRGFACSAVFSGGVLQSGVAALADDAA